MQHRHVRFMRVLLSALMCGILFGKNDKLPAAPASYKVEFGQGRSKLYDVIPTNRSKATQIVYINFQEDQEALSYTFDVLQKKIPSGLDAIVVIGDKATVLGAFLAHHHKIPWIVLSAKKPLRQAHGSVAYQSITNGSKVLYMTCKQAKQIKGKNVIILDDVLSTGKTMKAAIRLVRNASAKIRGIFVGFTEGTNRNHIFFDGKSYKIVKVGHLPIFTH